MRRLLIRAVIAAFVATPTAAMALPPAHAIANGSPSLVYRMQFVSEIIGGAVPVYSCQLRGDCSEY